MIASLITYLRQKGATLIVLLSFLAYVSGVTMFTHRHIIDGQIVYHSHLYSGTAEQPNHSHSSLQFNSLIAIAMYIALAAVTPISILVPATKVVAIIRQYSYRVIGQCKHLFQLRAPPALI